MFTCICSCKISDYQHFTRQKYRQTAQLHINTVHKGLKTVVKNVKNYPKDDQSVLIETLSCNLQFISELITTQKRFSSHGVTGSLYFSPYRATNLTCIFNHFASIIFSKKI